MGFEKILLEKEEKVATLTLNNPDKLNAMSTEMWRELARLVEMISKDDEINVLVITGAGRGFCAGTDVKGRLEARIRGERLEQTQKEMLAPVGHVAYLIRSLDIPIIGAINGVSVGAGFSLAMLCDIRMASETAKFSAIWVKLGIIGDVGATYLLPRIVGSSKAIELLTTGDMIGAEEAKRIGLVSHVFPADQLMPAVKEMAKKLAQGPPIAIKFMKRAVYKGIHNDLLSQLDFESFAQRTCMQTEDHKEAVKAFMEKRPPQFKGM